MSAHKNVSHEYTNVSHHYDADTQREAAIRILEVLQKRRRIRDTLSIEEYTIDPFIDMVIPLIENNKPFKMVLPAFQGKSINPDSVLGKIPDGAEEEAIRNLEEMCEEIKAVYAGGCELVIAHVGNFYSDINIVPNDETLDMYEAELKKMTKNPMIRFSNLMREFYSESQDEGRKMIREKYMISDEKLNDVISNVQSVREKYISYKSVVCHEYASVLMPEHTREKQRKLSKPLTYKWVQRYLAFRDACADAYPDHFRLSILAYPSKSKSFGINLIPNTSEFGLPWFHVLVKNPDGSVELIKKKEAEEAGYKLVYKDNNPWYYVKE